MPPSARDAGLGWAATASSGLLLGCVVCLMETAEQPLIAASWPALRHFLDDLAPAWLLSGLAWAFLARWADRRLSLVRLVACALLSLALAYGMTWGHLDRGTPLSARFIPAEARATHVLWATLFYGSLYTATYVASRRAVRSRRGLAGVAQARDEAAALLEEAQLEAFRRRLQPETLLDAVAAMQRLYRASPAAADELAEVLVEFLRRAMRSLSGAASTFAQEVDLAWRYAQLRSLSTGAFDFHVRLSDTPPPSTPFPGQILMPLLESLCSPDACIRLDGRWVDEAYVLSLSAEGLRERRLSPRLRDRIARCADRSGARFDSAFSEGLCGLSWIIRAQREAAAPALEEIAA